MANGKIKGKQIEDSTISLDKLSGSGSLTIGSSSLLRKEGTASNPDDIVTLKEIDGFGSGTSLTIDEFGGASYSNVEQITFRGGTVRTTDGGSEDDAGAVLVSGSGPKKVVVWIPAPSYKDYITIGNAPTTLRQIASPTIEGTPYNVGSFSTAVGSYNPVVNGNMNYNTGAFGYFDDTATFEINVYDFDDTTVIDTLSFPMSAVAHGGSTSSGSITFTMNNKVDDQDRRAANVTITINPSTADSEGGRLTNEIIFTNSEGGGAGDLTPPIFQTYFYDSDGSTSNADIDIPGGGTVSITENIWAPKYLSGVGYYDMGSTFTFSVTNIDNLNNRSYPLGISNQISNASTSSQMRVNPSSNFQMNSNQWHWVSNTDFNSWNTLYNQPNMSFDGSSSVNTTGITPGLNTNNTLNTSNYPNVTATLFDWSVGDSEVSPDYPCLIDTANDASDDTTEFFVDEDNRLTVWDLLNGSEVSFDSQQIISVSTGTYSYELQQIFGHLVYPKINFSSIYPQHNINNSINYSGSPTKNVTLTVINNITTLSTTSVSHNGYRWYVRKFSTPSAATSRGNGKIAFNTDFTESDLITQNTGSTGSSNLLLYLGLTNNTVPTAWYDLSKFSSSTPIQGPRANATGVGSDNLGSNATIQWNTGGVAGWTGYLLIGINNTSSDKEIESVEFNDLDNSDWG